AVTTDLPLTSAASAAASAAPSAPPINSTKRSMLGELANATQSSNHWNCARLIPRSFSLWLAETPAIVMGRPVRPCSAAAWRSKSLITAAPTVPRPAMPMRKGDGMNRAPAALVLGKGQKTAAGLLPEFQGTIKVRQRTRRWALGRKTKLAPSLQKLTL